MLRSFIAFVVHRRLVALAVTAAIGLYGLYAFYHTAIEAYPDVTNVQVGVIAQAPGLAPEEMERQITLPLERTLNGTPGLMALRSESYFGLSVIAAVFDDQTRSSDARVEVMQRLMQAELPDGVTPEMSPDSTPLGKIYYYRLNSDRHDLARLRTEQETTVTRVLKQVQGVADVVSIGGFLKEYHVEVDPARLHGFGLTLGDVVEAIAESNLNVGGGLMRRGEQALIVRGLGLLHTPDDIASVVLSTEGHTPVLVGDVATIVQSHTPRQGSVGMDEYDEVVQGIVLLRRDENPSRVLEEVQRRVDMLNTQLLPDGMRIEPVYDRSELVSLTLQTVYGNLLFGAVMIVGVLWLFLRSLRGSLIVATVIPLSLLVAFIGLHFLGLPANLISMGAIDFGIIVDGAVVLTENIIHKARQRRPQTRRDMYEVIIDAAVSVARPTLFAMAIIIAALIPIFTLESVEGRIFRPLALTYTFALLGALFFALVLIPALCAFFLKPKDVAINEPVIFERAKSAYARWVELQMTSKAVMTGSVLLALGILVITAIGASRLGTEFLPELDEGDAYVLVEMPPSISLEKGQEILRDVRLRLGAFPETVTVVSEQGRPEDGTDNETMNIAKVLVVLKQRSDWRPGLTKEALIDDMRETLAEIPGVGFNFAQPIRDSVEEATSGARGHVVLKLFGPEIEVLRDRLYQTRSLLQPVEGIVDLDLYRDAPAPQLHVQLDRQAMARYGISAETAATILETALAGSVATTLWEGEYGVPVRIRLPYADRMDDARIRDIMVPTAAGTSIPLHRIADIGIRIGNTSIFREDNVRYMALKFNVEGRDIGSVVRESIAAFEENIVLPEGYNAAWGGEWENQRRAAERLQYVIPLSLIIVFALLFSALDHARSASVVLMMAPFAMVGGIAALHVQGIDLSISAAVGFIALLGQVALVGLLVLSAVEELRRQGKSMTEAFREGAAERMRSVVLVCLLALLGLLPMAISTGLGSETQQPFASVIVGGMIALPIVALFILPVLYRLFGPRTMLTHEEMDAMALRD